MPFGRITKRTMRELDSERRYKKRLTASRRTPKASMVRIKNGPISDKISTKLRYSELSAITYAGFNVPGSQQYRLNGLFDPDLSGTGHQPLGFDQYGALYNRYRVLGCKWKVTFANRSTAYQCDIAVQPRPNVASQGNMNTVYESIYTKSAVLGVQGSGQAIKSISGYTNIAKIRGVSPSVVNNDDQYQSLITTNPITQPVLTLYTLNQVTNVPVTIAIRVELQYYCVFYDRKLLSES